MTGAPASPAVFAWVCEPCAAIHTAPEPWGAGVSRYSYARNGKCFVCQQMKRPTVEWRPLLNAPTAEELLS